jgi:hypothetical protein
MAGQAVRVFTYTDTSTTPRWWLATATTLVLWTLSAWLALLPVLYCCTALSSLKEETLTIIKDVGIQLTKVHRNGSTSHQFYERSLVRDVVINEVRET